ncbi:MAG: hypothetical protein QOE59_857, partial [Actinomycetota bacterium]|nr:hypothetical protein [Actinomycetota bacterium]
RWQEVLAGVPGTPRRDAVGSA